MLTCISTGWVTSRSLCHRRRPAVVEVQRVNDAWVRPFGMERVLGGCEAA